MSEENEVPELVQKKESTKGFLSSFSGSLPTLTIIIIALGLSKQAMYYSNFNVPIKYFLGISELSLIISVDLLIAFVIMSGTVVYLFVNLTAILVLSRQKNNWLLVITPTLLFFVSLGGAIIIATTIASRLIWSCFALGSFSWMFFLGYKKYLLKIFNVDSKVFLITVFVSISTLCWIMLKTGFDLIGVENGFYKGTKIYTTDSIYTSTDSSYFIGKTEKYVFIYNAKKKSTRIIPSESVTMIDMQSK